MWLRVYINLSICFVSLKFSIHVLWFFEEKWNNAAYEQYILNARWIIGVDGHGCQLPHKQQNCTKIKRLKTTLSASMDSIGRETHSIFFRISILLVASHFVKHFNFEE